MGISTMKIQPVLYIGLFMLLHPFCQHSNTMVSSLPIEFVNKLDTKTIKYPIHVACECDNYQIYVDGRLTMQASVIEDEDYLETGWNSTKIFIPEINNETPKIIGFHATGGQFSGFMNGFIMDMNNGADYTKYQEWKCMDFADLAVPLDWYMYEYDDSLWGISKSYGMNYQNNSYQIFEHERFGIHLNAQWLWTQNNANSNIFCRKKNKHVQAIPPPPTTPVPTSAPHVIPGVLHTTHHIPAPTAAPTAAQKVTTTSAPHVIPGVLHTTHHIPAPTAAPTAAQKVTTTSAPTPLQKVEPKVEPKMKKNTEIRNIYNIKNNIKIIINNAESSKNQIDKHILSILHHLDLSRSDDNQLYKIVKLTHTHLHNHYNNIVDYYKKLLEGISREDSTDDESDDNHGWSDRFDEGEKGEKREKQEKQEKRDKKKKYNIKEETKEEKEIRLKKSSKLIESMIKLNHYIKVIEYKIHFIKGETKYNLLHILYSLRKQYQDDMIQMLKYL